MIWRVIEAGVHKRATERRIATVEELWQAIQDAWNEDLTAAKIEMSYRLLEEVMALCAANRGGNAFKLPHSGLRAGMREDGWPGY